jgi:hypothetical protein
LSGSEAPEILLLLATAMSNPNLQFAMRGGKFWIFVGKEIEQTRLLQLNPLESTVT